MEETEVSITEIDVKCEDARAESNFMEDTEGSVIDENQECVTEILIDMDDMEWVSSNSADEEEEESDKNCRETAEQNILVIDQDSNIEYRQPRDLLSITLTENPPSQKLVDPVVAVDKFWSEHNCSENCTDKFTQDEVLQLRSACEALNEYVDGTNRLDLVILSMIRALVRKKKVKRRQIKKNPLENGDTDTEKERKKHTVNFMVEGQSVCRGFFLFVHNIGVKRWRRLMATYKKEGLIEKYHGLCNRKPANTTPLESVQFVVQFLQDYCDERAVPLHGRQGNARTNVKMLPVGESKASVYTKYVEACGNHSGILKTVSRISFNRIWRQCCPHVVTHKPPRSSVDKHQTNGHTSECKEPGIEKIVDTIIRMA